MLFIDNKYTKIYNLIIQRGKNRVIEGYTEKHHIIPKSLGGDNSEDNLVRLTAREHFICHLLLTKMTTGKDRRKMVYAAHFLARTSSGGAHGERLFKVNSRLYEKLSIEQADMARIAQQSRTLSDETKRKISIAHKGRIVSAETRMRLSKTNTGRKHSELAKLNISIARKNGKKADNIKCEHCGVFVDPGNYGQWHGDNCHLVSTKDRSLTSEQKAKIGAANRGRVLAKTQCPHCNKFADGGNYTRWHGDNCKHKE